jgi:hypothetical protein
MDKNICKKIIENKERFIPHLFTERQVGIMEKYVGKRKLSSTEKTYLYSTIKKKVGALAILKEEYHIAGREMIPERVEKAKEILKEINKDKAFISGSFLFKKDHKDIDIYVISRRRKDYYKGNKHFIFITEKNLRNPIFFSSLKYSVANFSTEEVKPAIKRLEFNDLITAYEMAINEIIDNDDQKMVRDVVFEYYLRVKKIILDSFSLYKKFYEIKKKKIKEKVKIINDMAKELLLKLYSKKYLYNELGPFLKQLERAIKEYKTHDNMIIYLNLLREVKDECRRAEA